MEKKIELLILKICDDFADNSIDYIIIGGIPAILYGVERVTYDIDFAVPDDKSILKKIIDILRRIGYETIHDCTTKEFIMEIKKLSVEQLLKKKCLSFRDKEDKLFPIDVIPADHGLIKHLKDDEIEFPMGDSKIYIASLEQLIRWKESIGREKDLQDVVELKNILKKLPKKYYE